MSRARRRPRRLRYELPPGEDGKRRQREIAYRGTKREANEKLTALLAQIGKGVIVHDNTLTMNDLIELYLQSKRAEDREATTLEWYERNFSCHVKPVIGTMRLRDLRTQHVQKVLADARCKRGARKDQPLSKTAKRNLLVSMRVALQYAVDNGFVAMNEGRKVKLGKTPRAITGALSRDESHALIKAFADSELAAVVAVALDTGARRGELCALQNGDFDEAQGVLFVRRSAANVGRRGERRVVLKTPKTEGSVRTIFLTTFSVAVLRWHRAEQAKRLGVEPKETDPLFTRFDGTAWDPNEMSRIFTRTIRRKNLRANNLASIRLHDLRHAYASLSYREGVPLKLTSLEMGHSKTSTTDQIYTHVNADARRDAALQREAIFAPMLPVFEGTSPI